MPPVTSTVRYATLATFVGQVLVAATSCGVVCVAFQDGDSPCVPAPTWVHEPRALSEAVEQLQAYFAGHLTAFTLRRHTDGTPFREAVWDVVASIPFGHQASYGSIATELGKPNAARAVGQANGANPVPILVPCHRVIGKQGHLTGFSGGLNIKNQLIEHEQRVRPHPRSQLSFFA